MAASHEAVADHAVADDDEGLAVRAWGSSCDERVSPSGCAGGRGSLADAARRRRGSRRSRWWRGWTQRRVLEDAQARIRPALTPAQAQTSASSGEQRSGRRGGARPSAARRARRGPSTVRAVVELGDQADPRQVADERRGDDARRRGRPACGGVPATGLVTSTTSPSARLRVAEHGDVEAGGAQPGDGAGRRRTSRPAGERVGEDARPAPRRAARTRWSGRRARRSRRSRGSRSSVTEVEVRRRRRRGARSGRRAGPARWTGRPPAVSTTRSVSRV